MNNSYTVPLKSALKSNTADCESSLSATQKMVRFEDDDQFYKLKSIYNEIVNSEESRPIKELQDFNREGELINDLFYPASAENNTIAGLEFFTPELEIVSTTSNILRDEVKSLEKPVSSDTQVNPTTVVDDSAFIALLNLPDASFTDSSEFDVSAIVEFINSENGDSNLNTPEYFQQVIEEITLVGDATDIFLDDETIDKILNFEETIENLNNEMEIDIEVSNPIQEDQQAVAVDPNNLLALSNSGSFFKSSADQNVFNFQSSPYEWSSDLDSPYFGAIQGQWTNKKIFITISPMSEETKLLQANLSSIDALIASREESGDSSGTEYTEFETVTPPSDESPPEQFNYDADIDDDYEEDDYCNTPSPKFEVECFDLPNNESPAGYNNTFGTMRVDIDSKAKDIEPEVFVNLLQQATEEQLEEAYEEQEQEEKQDYCTVDKNALYEKALEARKLEHKQKMINKQQKVPATKGRSVKIEITQNYMDMGINWLEKYYSPFITFNGISFPTHFEGKNRDNDVFCYEENRNASQFGFRRSGKESEESRRYNFYEPLVFRYHTEDKGYSKHARYGLCPYCHPTNDKLNAEGKDFLDGYFYEMNNSGYLHHVTKHHGVFSNGCEMPYPSALGRAREVKDNKAGRVVNVIEAVECPCCQQNVKLGKGDTGHCQLLGFFRHLLEHNKGGRSLYDNNNRNGKRGNKRQL